MKACTKKKLVTSNMNKVSQKKKGAISNYLSPKRNVLHWIWKKILELVKMSKLTLLPREIDLDRSS